MSKCMADRPHHSDDTMTVFHGYAEPAIGCGYHVAHEISAVFAGHRVQMIRQGELS